MSDSEKRKNFYELAESRTNKVLSMIRKFRHFANQSRYEYTEEEIEKMFSAVESELAMMKRLLLEPREFKFSENSGGGELDPTLNF